MSAGRPGAPEAVARPLDDLVRFEAAGLRWTAETAAAPALEREVAGRLDELRGAAGVEVLKSNLVRTVLRVPLAGGTRVVVKRYAVRGLRDRLKYLVRPSRAAAEWRAGRGLAAAGVPTCVPLAMGERRRFVLRDAALVTREIEDALHLNAYVEAHLGGAAEERLRRALYDELARVVRRMHDAGFVHHDLHGGNVLVSGPPEAPRLHVIDLHSVTRSARPTAGARWFDLVKLLHSMLTCSTVEERLRIGAVYESEGGPSGTDLGRLLAAGTLAEVLEPQLAAMERRRVASRTSRSLTRSTKFEISRAGGFRIHHLRALDPAALAEAVSRHVASMERGGPEVLKDARRSALSRQALGQAGLPPRRVVVKEYRSDRPTDLAKDLVRRPRAVAAWLAGNGLCVRGFPAAEPLALLLRGRGPARRRAYLVMEDLGDGSRADLVALDRFAGELDPRRRGEKRELVRAAARLVRELHSSGVYHSDLKAVNLFLREDGGRPAFVLADYDRVEFDRPVPRRRRIKNLAQLSASVPICITVTDRLRFFRDYSEHSPSLRRAWKRWFRGVQAECRRKIVVRMEPIE